MIAETIELILIQNVKVAHTDKDELVYTLQIDEIKELSEKILNELNKK